MFFKIKVVATLLILLGTFNLSFAQSMKVSSNQKSYAFRLKPHEDLKRGIIAFAAEQKIKAGCIVTAVGSLEQVNLRFANQNSGSNISGHYEIVSLVGTFSETYSHLHLSVADSLGVTIGGHLLEGNRIYTTAEIVLTELTDLEFRREKDNTYGYEELSVIQKK